MLESVGSINVNSSNLTIKDPFSVKLPFNSFMAEVPII